jgi:6-phosphogluconolactonase
MELLRLGEGAKAAAGKKVCALIEEAQGSNAEVVVGLPGGNSVKPILRAIAESDLPLEIVHFFWVDERFVPHSDPDSNFKQAMDFVFQELVLDGRIPRENLHEFPYNPIDEGQDLQNYYDQFDKLGGEFHVLVLGSGEDGHIASLFPGHSYWQSRQPALFFERDSPKPPSTRVTFGPPVFEGAQRTVLLFLGEGKRKALEHFLSDRVDPLDCPAKIVEENDELYVFTDLD